MVKIHYKCVCVCVCVCKKSWKNKKSKIWLIYYENRRWTFRFSDVFQDFKFIKNVVRIAMDVWWNILTTFFMNLKSWRRLSQPKRSTSTFIINSSNSGLFCFFNFSSYCRINFLIYFQCLINRDRHRHATSKGIDSYY